MGPLFFRAENGDVPPPPESRASLQWGRSFSERRTGFPASVTTNSRAASMGPLFFRAENTSHQIAIGVENRELQWGRSFSERRTLSLSHTGPGYLSASMGPLFFRAENDYPAKFWGSQQWQLQWGRSFSERRTSRRHGRGAAAASFNGAALFQSGERVLRVVQGEQQRRLQWGRSFSERRTSNWAEDCRNARSLQWGRSFSERRTWHAQRPDLDNLAASMGPLFFRAENGEREPTGRDDQASFNGAALFQSGEPESGSNCG